MIKLISVLVAGIPAIIAGLIAFLGRKIGVASASIASMLFLTAALIVAINGIYSAVLTTAVLPAWLATGMGALVPSTFGATVAAIVSARIVGAAYDLAMGKVKAINSAN